MSALVPRTVSCQNTCLAQSLSTRCKHPAKTGIPAEIESNKTSVHKDGHNRLIILLTSDDGDDPCVSHQRCALCSLFTDAYIQNIPAVFIGLMSD